MDKDTRRRVIRAARTLLQWDQQRFAKALEVGEATLKRYEAGYPVAEETEAKMLTGLTSTGVVVIDGASVGGRRVTAGVALLPDAVIGYAPTLRDDAAQEVRKKGVRSPVKEPDPANPSVKPRKVWRSDKLPDET